MLRPVLRAVIFDLHGTLLDDEPLRVSLLRALAAEHAIEIDAVFAASLAGSDDRTALRQIWSQAGRQLPPDELRRLLAEKQRRYAAAIGDRPPLFPGARAIFEEAARRVPVGVVATSLRADALTALKCAGFFRRLCALVTAEEAPAPSAAAFEACLASINRVATRYRLEPIAPRETLVFEDTQAGIAAAQAAGMKVAAVAHTQRFERLAQAETHAARIVDFELAALERELF